MTHFLLETRFQEMVRYYQAIAQIEPGIDGVPRDVIVATFDEIFGPRQALESEWRTYMDGVKTDSQKLTESR